MIAVAGAVAGTVVRVRAKLHLHDVHVGQLLQREQRHLQGVLGVPDSKIIYMCIASLSNMSTVAIDLLAHTPLCDRRLQNAELMLQKLCSLDDLTSHCELQRQTHLICRNCLHCQPSYQILKCVHCSEPLTHETTLFV